MGFHIILTSVGLPYFLVVDLTISLAIGLKVTIGF